MKATPILLLLALCLSAPSLTAQERQKRIKVTVNDSVIVEEQGLSSDDSTAPAARKVVRRSIRMPRMAGVPGVPGVPGVLGVPGFDGSMRMFTGVGGRDERVMGLSLRTLNPQLGAYFGAPEGKGVLVEEVKEGSAAAKAGFKAGDVIVRAGKKTLERSSELRTVIAAHDKGEKITVEVLRKGSKQTLTIEADATERVRRHVFRVPGDDGDEELDIDIDIEEIMNEVGTALEGVQDEVRRARERIESVHEL